MNHDVFISYSSKNKPTATAICHTMEEHKIKCWIAPRDIEIGQQYGTVIEKAIKECKVFIILFSKDASLSPWVESELNIAFTERRVIMPFRIDETELEGEMRLMLNKKHWIDAYPKPEERFQDLVIAVANTLGRPIVPDGDEKSSVGNARDTEAGQQTKELNIKDQHSDNLHSEGRKEGEVKRENSGKEEKRRGSSKKILLLAIVSVLIVAIAIYLVARHDVVNLPDASLQQEIARIEADEQLRNIQDKTITINNLNYDKVVDGEDGLGGITINDISFDMIGVRGGTFFMGAQGKKSSLPCYDQDAMSDESPVHGVTLNGFYIGKYEVTQGLWEAVMEEHVDGEGDDYPMHDLSWENIQQFLVRLNKLTGYTFRLPTEAEWEYAARGGEKSNNYKYSGSNNIDDVAWYDDNSGEQVHPVGTKLSNELGIHDMSGNVPEICDDIYLLYGKLPQVNPKGSTDGAEHVIRGGGWSYDRVFNRVSSRDMDTFGSGFRLVMDYTTTNIFTDTRDGKSYAYVTIGEQDWMAENLAYLPSVYPYSVGSEQEGNEEKPYYYVNGYNGTDVADAKAADNYTTYGVLYNWVAAMGNSASSNSYPSGVQGVCPTGWHLPSNAEWAELTDYLGGDSVAGDKLKEVGSEHWVSPYNDNIITTNATNETGFTALPGGFRSDTHFNLGGSGYWWSSTEYDAYQAFNPTMNFYSSDLDRSSTGVKSMGFSVRCVKD